MYGKELRLSRLINQETKRLCIVPIDHGTTLGPIQGLVNSVDTISHLVNGGAEAVVLHKGLLAKVAKNPHLANGRYLMHLSVSTNLSNFTGYKVLVGTVEEAVKLGADGISVHINLGNEYENEMITQLGLVSQACNEWGMPLLAMMYSHKNPKEPYHIQHVARLGEELGADILKVDYPGSYEAMVDVVNSVQIPVLISGGAHTDDTEQLLYMISESLRAGAAGVSIGRNVFQGANPQEMTALISKLVHGKLTYSECCKLMKAKKEGVLI
ncbi:deoxyribose-phosphate aldolase [Brevibacillus antibioticus]|uniref:Deoxyribose-phosphate aldolase n=1 Tax=Brevibacillus antibioticus TaxID=2570228 RepID=A0A4V5TJR9_9BACL|nr:2-amino-3,7-dideoxy-D-threo-hept-6-ulosonate synthase [Brevibacillus antibioticus]TKI55083.1 deoxyribose-phosphate aldolase [Brevibacillus antibioticus]